MRRAILLVAALCAVAGAAGCGGGEGMKPPPVPPPARAEDFPKPHGRTVHQLRAALGPAGGPTLAVSVSQLEQGWDRFGFALFDRARAQIAAAPAAVYVGRAGRRAAGPFPARWEALGVKRRFESRTVAKDPNAAKGVYVARPRFRRAGSYQVLGVVRLDQRLVAAASIGPAVRVGWRAAVPAVGQRPSPIHTPTAASVRGDVSRIDTRDPPDDMHAVDFASAFGRRPVAILFASPRLCPSRVCGPVVDIAEQVKAHHPDVAFIHMEVYRDNDPRKGFRPQLLRWHLRSQPWLFTLDRRGRIAARIEGAFGAEEMERAVSAAQGR
ncbi:MAG TPA: hypothetical protein VE780_13825 [Thermoleophilaceae bacterium]|nr:hypothetical protein [Thermoleophilaceae bacterium]